MNTLALLSLLPLTLVPVYERVLLGTQKSGGNLASWAADDFNARTICKLFVAGVRPPVQVNLGFDTGTTAVPTSMGFRIKIASHTPGLQRLTILIKSQTTDFDNTTVVNVPLEDGRTYIARPLASLDRYIQPDGTVVLRVETKPVGPSTSFYPCSAFEYANADLTY